MRPSPRNRSALLVATPPAAPGQRIGLMGGSFDPPHDGHLAVARTALRRLRLDRVWWLVSPGNPLKSNDALPPQSERIAACRALTRNEPRIVVSGLEADLASAYTIDTLAFLTRRYPQVRFVWLMGADNLTVFHRWRRWREIAALAPIAVVDRPGWHLPALASPAARALERHRQPAARAAALPGLAAPAWVFLPTRLSPLSSTALRRAAGRTGTRRQEGRFP